MHKKILLCLNRNQFESFDYKIDYTKAMNYLLGENSGNNVFQYSLQKLLTNGKNEINVDTLFLLHSTKFDAEIDYINSEYDCLVFSPANLISKYASEKLLIKLTERINKLKIPVYAIGLGAQSDRNYSLNYLKNIRKPCIDFIKAILNTDGRIGLRGFFTAEVLNALGFNENDYTVIGCPSLFMKGGNVRVNKLPLNSPNELITAINGFRAWNNKKCGQYLKQHNSSIFIDQDEFYKLLYKDKDFDWKEYQYLADPLKNWYTAYKNNQIKLYGDFPTWYNDLKNLNINFSFGCRIHGNVVPLLAGIPSYIDTFDSRVKELAEYFNIPNGYLNEGFDNPWELYEKADYAKFNKEFPQKYKIFKNFMSDCGLYIDISTPIHNFCKLPEISNKKYIEDLSDKLSKPKKIIFVAHEFGLFNGHGGIASYLYNICSWLLKATNSIIYVFAQDYDKNSDLLKNTRFNFLPLNGNLTQQREFIYTHCKDLQPDYIEFAEFSGLGLTCVEHRNDFLNTILVTNNHTSTKEIYEWGELKPFCNAPSYLKSLSCEEIKQMKNSDYCFAPSKFLAQYVTRNYNLSKPVLHFANPFFEKLEPKNILREKLENEYDFTEYDKTFNIVLITRFENRKCHKKLVRAFLNILTEDKRIRLILAGNTSFTPDKKDCREELYKSIPQEAKKYIQIYGFLNMEEQEKFMAIADLVVMPSTFENQPVAMVETVMRQIPVIGSIYSGLADYSDSKLLFNPFIEKDLENRIKNFISLSLEERLQLQQNQFENLKKEINPNKSILPRFDLKKNKHCQQEVKISNFLEEKVCNMHF